MISASAEIHLENFIILQHAIHDGMIEGLNTGGGFIVDLASQFAPEDTGELKLSGRHSVSDTILEVSFGNDLPDDRAIAQEFGTIFMPAQPYIYPAIKEIDIVQVIADAIRSRL